LFTRIVTGDIAHPSSRLAAAISPSIASGSTRLRSSHAARCSAGRTSGIRSCTGCTSGPAGTVRIA
jgi:hypothetical protein